MKAKLLQPEKPDVQLTLSNEEASALYSLLGHHYGIPDGFGDIFSRMYNELGDLGITDHEDSNRIKFDNNGFQVAD